MTSATLPTQPTSTEGCSPSIMLPDSKISGSSGIYVSARFPIVLDKVPEDYPQSPFEAFKNSYKKWPDRPMLGQRERTSIDGDTFGAYSWATYSKCWEGVAKFGLGLRSLLPDSKKMFGLCSRARPEWLIADLAGQGYGMVSVILYASYGPDALRHVIKQTKLEVMVCDLKAVGQFLSMASSLPSLKTLVCMEALHEGSSAVNNIQLWAKEKGITLMDMGQVMALGESRGGPAVASLATPIPPDQLLTVAYTSGTTDLPKGVMLGGAQFSAVLFSLSITYPSTDESILRRMEYLPYSHIHIRARAYYSISKGHSLGYYSGREDYLLDDIYMLQPMILPLTPALASGLRAAVLANIDTTNPFIKKLFEVIFTRKQNALHNLTPPNAEPGYVGSMVARISSLGWSESLVFGYARRLLGGRVKLITHGSRPIPPDDLEFLQIVLGAHAVQAYGATESCGQGFSTSFKGQVCSPHIGHVGGVVPLIQAKLVDCPELEYAVTDRPHPRGEIWLRGASVSQGYFGSENQKVVDEDGWYATGDIATLDSAKGEFTIIDRKANFFRLSQGMYITPEKVEAAYLKLPMVSEIYVPSETKAPAAVAIVVPHPREFLGWVGYHFQRPTVPQDLVALCADPEVQTAFCTAINNSISSRKNQINPQELVQALYLEPRSFSSVNQDLTTPENKFKRNHLKRHYSEQISSLYRRIEELHEADGADLSSGSNSRPATNTQPSRRNQFNQISSKI